MPEQLVGILQIDKRDEGHGSGSRTDGTMEEALRR
jgi:hypothetical protein